MLTVPFELHPLLTTPSVPVLMKVLMKVTFNYKARMTTI